MDEVKIRCLRGSVHVQQRLDEKKIPKKILDGRFYNSRMRSRVRMEGSSKIGLPKIIGSLEEKKRSQRRMETKIKGG